MKAAQLINRDPSLGEVFSEAEIQNFLNGMSPRMTEGQALASIQRLAANTNPVYTAAPELELQQDEPVAMEALQAQPEEEEPEEEDEDETEDETEDYDYQGDYPESE